MGHCWGAESVLAVWLVSSLQLLKGLQTQTGMFKMLYVSLLKLEEKRDNPRDSFFSFWQDKNRYIVCYFYLSIDSVYMLITGR